MSRIGKHPIAVPAGVEVKVDGSTVTVKGCLLYTSDAADD